MAVVGGYLGFIGGARNFGGLASNSLWMAKTPAPQNATVNAILIETGGGAGLNMRAVVYDGTPSALLRSSAIIASPPAGVVRFLLSSPLNLTAGSSYHFGYIADGNPNLAYGAPIGGPSGSGAYVLGGLSAANPPNPVVGANTAPNNNPFSAMELDGSSQTDNGFSPLDIPSGVTLSSANAVVTFSSAANLGARSVTNRPGGRAYAEIVIGGTINSSVGIGVVSANWTPFRGALQSYSYTYFLLPTGVVNGNTNGVTYAAGDVIGIAYDGYSNLLWWNKNNGSWFGNSTTPGNLVTGAGGYSVVAGWPIGVAVATGATGTAASFTLRDTAGAFQYTPPVGFVPWVNYFNPLEMTIGAVEEWVRIPGSPPLAVTIAAIEMWATPVSVIPPGAGGQARTMVVA